MKLLVGYGCDTAQGYFFSRPVPSKELREWLETSPFGVRRRLPRLAAKVDPVAVTAPRKDSSRPSHAPDQGLALRSAR